MQTEKDIIALIERFPFKEQLQGKSLFLTGVTGQLGSAMARFLSALNGRFDLGIQIIGQTRNAMKARLSRRIPQEVRLIECPLDALQGSVSEGEIDFIIHFAAPTTSLFFVQHPVETVDAIVNGTKEALDFARCRHAKGFLYVSSMEVYGDVSCYTGAVKENQLGYLDISNPRSSYPMAKRMAEHLSLCFGREYGLPVKIARPCQTFGACLSDDDHRVYAQIARSVHAGTPVVLHTTGEQSHCFCETYDMVSGLLYVLLTGEDQGIYNIANPDTYCSIRQMAERVCAYFGTGSEVQIELDPTRGYPPATQLLLDTERIRSLGWTPRKGLLQMYENMIDSL